MSAYIAHIKMNMRLTFRDRTVVFFNYLFPLIFFFMFAQLYHAEQIVEENNSAVAKGQPHVHLDLGDVGAHGS